MSAGRWRSWLTWRNSGIAPARAKAWAVSWSQLTPAVRRMRVLGFIVFVSYASGRFIPNGMSRRSAVILSAAKDLAGSRGPFSFSQILQSLSLHQDDYCGLSRGWRREGNLARFPCRAGGVGF